MYARVMSVTLRATTTAPELLWVHEKLLPILKQLSGFRGYQAMVDTKHGRAIAISYWETLVDLRGTSEELERVRAQIIGELGATDVGVEEYEVAYPSTAPQWSAEGPDPRQLDHFNFRLLSGACNPIVSQFWSGSRTLPPDSDEQSKRPPRGMSG